MSTFDAESHFKADVDLSDKEAISSIGEMMADLRRAMEDLKPAIEQAENQKKEFKSQIDVKRSEIDELTKASHAIDLQTYDIKRKMREIEKEMSRQEGLLKQAAENKRMADEFADLAKEFDTLTAGAPWREWAFPHQIEGAKKLAVACTEFGGAILADKRGLGKSLTGLAMLDMLQAQKVIAFVPNDTVDNYIREIKHWAPHRTVVKLAGLPKVQREFAMTMAAKVEQAIVVVNFEAWRRDKKLLELMEEFKPEAIIIDEAHNVKDTKSIAFRGINQVVKANNKCPECGAGKDKLVGHTDSYSGRVTNLRCTACEFTPGSESEFFAFSSVKAVLPMTGTPILNKPHDLFALLTLIDPVNFNHLQTYLNRYADQDFYTKKWSFRRGGLERLTNQLASKFVMRSRESAGIVIPPQEIQIYNIEFDHDVYPRQSEVLATLNQHAAILLDTGDEGATILPILYTIAVITRKRQAITWPAGIQLKDRDGAVVMQVSAFESIKLDKIISCSEGDEGVECTGIVPEVIGVYDEDNHNGTGFDGERVVVFSQFKEPLKELERRLKEAKIPVVRYDGDTPDEMKPIIQEDFDAKTCNVNGYKKKFQVVLANYKSGGEGLNFTGASQMIILDEAWNPGKVEQAYGRIDRMGQTKETTVHVLRVKGSIDTWMANLIEQKEAMIGGFEANVNIAQELLDAIRNGEVL